MKIIVQECILSLSSLIMLSQSSINSVFDEFEKNVADNSYGFMHSILDLKKRMKYKTPLELPKRIYKLPTCQEKMLLTTSTTTL